MKVFIVDDDPVSMMILKQNIESWGYELETSINGSDALEKLKNTDTKLIILDWVLPDISGIEICKKIREYDLNIKSYIIFLTSKTEMEELIEAFEAGADDFLSKPVNPSELKSRLNAGRKIIELQEDLNRKIAERDEALSHIKQLQGLISICSYCHKIRNDESSWEKLEKYISKHSNAHFSHGICPECMKEHFPEYFKEN